MPPCLTHKAFRSRKKARPALRYHQQKQRPHCIKCRMGLIFGFWHCGLCSAWHTGHARPRPA